MPMANSAITARVIILQYRLKCTLLFISILVDCVRKFSVAVFEYEDGFHRFGKIAGNLERQRCGGEKPAFLYGYDGLAAYADGLGQFLLGDALLGPLNLDSILHLHSFYCSVASPG